MTPSTAPHSPTREGFSLDVSRFPNVLVTLSYGMSLPGATVDEARAWVAQVTL